MSDQCSICRHPECEDINMALLAGQLSLRQIAAKWGVSRSALSRHKRKHLPAHLMKASQAEEIASADRLVEHLEALRKKALDIMRKAEKADELNTALAGIREARLVIGALAQVMTVADIEEQLTDLEERLLEQQRRKSW